MPNNETCLMGNADHTMRGLRFERDGAAQSTVEAVMYELREYGIKQLRKTNTQRRLAEVSDRQLREVIGRLEKLQPKYSRITEALISMLKEQLA